MGSDLCAVVRAMEVLRVSYKMPFYMGQASLVVAVRVCKTVPELIVAPLIVFERATFFRPG